jgi:hypothetical protein
MPNLEVAATVSDGLAPQHRREDAQANDVVQTARDLVGLHATGAPNPGCSCGRVSGFERSMLDRELYEQRSLARVRCMRGTLFALPLDLLPLAWAATRCRASSSDRARPRKPRVYGSSSASSATRLTSRSLTAGNQAPAAGSALRVSTRRPSTTSWLGMRLFPLTPEGGPAADRRRPQAEAVRHQQLAL